MTFHGPLPHESPAIPYAFTDSAGGRYSFTPGFFADQSEHVILESVLAYNADISGMFADQVNSGWMGFAYIA